MRNKFFKGLAITGMILVVLALIGEIVYHSITFNKGTISANDFVWQIVISIIIYSVCFVLLFICVKFRNSRK